MWDFQKRRVILIFFSKNVFHPYERARRVGHENRGPRKLLKIQKWTEIR